MPDALMRIISWNFRGIDVILVSLPLHILGTCTRDHPWPGINTAGGTSAPAATTGRHRCVLCVCVLLVGVSRRLLLCGGRADVDCARRCVRSCANTAHRCTAFHLYEFWREWTGDHAGWTHDYTPSTRKAARRCERVRAAPTRRYARNCDRSPLPGTWRSWTCRPETRGLVDQSVCVPQSTFSRPVSLWQVPRRSRWRRIWDAAELPQVRCRFRRHTSHSTNSPPTATTTTLAVAAATSSAAARWSNRCVRRLRWAGSGRGRRRRGERSAAKTGAAHRRGTLTPAWSAVVERWSLGRSQRRRSAATLRPHRRQRQRQWARPSVLSTTAPGEASARRRMNWTKFVAAVGGGEAVIHRATTAWTLPGRTLLSVLRRRPSTALDGQRRSARLYWRSGHVAVERWRQNSISPTEEAAAVATPSTSVVDRDHRQSPYTHRYCCCCCCLLKRSCEEDWNWWQRLIRCQQH